MAWGLGIRLMPVVCRRAIVTGRVQGVFYRATSAEKARALGLEGYARNLPDGRVEVLARGRAAAVEEFLQWLWIGSTASKVTAVETVEAEWPDQMPEGFSGR